MRDLTRRSLVAAAALLTAVPPPPLSPPQPALAIDGFSLNLLPENTLGRKALENALRPKVIKLPRRPINQDFAPA